MTESIKNQISNKEVSNATANISKQTKHLWTDYQRAARDVSEFIVKLKQLRQEAKWLGWESLVLKEKEILITQDQLNWARSRLRALTEEVSGRMSWLKGMFKWLGKSVQTWLFYNFGAFSVAWLTAKMNKGIYREPKRFNRCSYLIWECVCWCKKDSRC